MKPRVTGITFAVCLVILLASSAVGCDGGAAPQGVASSPSGEATSVVRVVPGGLRSEGLVHDGPTNSQDAASALAAARSEYRELAEATYDDLREASGSALPRTLRAFMSETTCALVPVYEIPATETVGGRGSDLFRLSRPALGAYMDSAQKAESGKGSYVLLAVREGRVVGAIDWYWGANRRAPDEAALRKRPWLWQSFYGDFGWLEFPAAEQRLRTHFATDTVLVRYLQVPRGYWVVGRAGGDERAVFIGHQGSFDDDPKVDRLYTADEVLEYGAPHADGR